MARILIVCKAAPPWSGVNNLPTEASVLHLCIARAAAHACGEPGLTAPPPTRDVPSMEPHPYQFVSRDPLPNRQSEYKRLGDIINDARLAGLVDWGAIVDRTRNIRALSHWSDPAAIVEAAANRFAVDKWADQPRRVEVWIEKDALVGVFEPVCDELDVPLFSCRGYTSQSEVWGAAQRLERYLMAGQEVVILHFGDHDPSGLDMTRDIRERLRLFLRHDFVQWAR